MSEIVFFLEEPSAKAMLDGLLPRLLPVNVHYRCIVFEGKQDLERQLVRRMRHYRVPEARFIVLRDQDAEDCYDVKSRITSLCQEAQRPGTLVRIACRELESWYLADLKAVQDGLRIDGLARLQNKKTYRSPDDIHAPSKILCHIAPSYQKISGSRQIGPHLDLENTRSSSFAVFITCIRQIVEKIK